MNLEGKIGLEDYPLLEKRPELLFTPLGVGISGITINAYRAGRLPGEDCRISKESLVFQAEIAARCGNPQLADNFIRASELVGIPSQRILEIYDALRPYRSTMAELQAIAQELARDYGADRTAAFILEASKVMQQRHKLKGDR